ncbi:MAG: hypothetical protein A3H25_03960 [Sphingomonadales bacterium RIFCSPLOWO2_12_FULL_63_15]|nr:MAG: hypothetical protein A3H25_03960 [Sphingomonadales bacterium RIFCSPLOWO2_12_FULL_63_15]
MLTGLQHFDPSKLGTKFRASAWKDDFVHAPLFQALGDQLIRRSHVFDAYRKDVALGVVWTIVWGYPSGKISQYDKKGGDACAAIDKAPEFATVIDDLRKRQPLPVQEIISALNKVSSGAATSTTSKIAYFSGLIGKEGPCLIFDKQVVRAIFTLKDAAIMPLRNAITPTGLSASASVDDFVGAVTTRGNQEKFYPAYLAGMTNLSFKLGRRYPPELIEQFLFARRNKP